MLSEFEEGFVLFKRPVSASGRSDDCAPTHPGQATAGYYGYLNLQGLHTQAELAQRDNFDPQAFHRLRAGAGIAAAGDPEAGGAPGVGPSRCSIAKRYTALLPWRSGVTPKSSGAIAAENRSRH